VMATKFVKTGRTLCFFAELQNEMVINTRNDALMLDQRMLSALTHNQYLFDPF